MNIFTYSSFKFQEIQLHLNDLIRFQVSFEMQHTLCMSCRLRTNVSWHHSDIKSFMWQPLYWILTTKDVNSSHDDVFSTLYLSCHLYLSVCVSVDHTLIFKLSISLLILRSNSMFLSSIFHRSKPPNQAHKCQLQPYKSSSGVCVEPYASI